MLLLSVACAKPRVESEVVHAVRVPVMADALERDFKGREHVGKVLTAAATGVILLEWDGPVAGARDDEAAIRDGSALPTGVTADPETLAPHTIVGHAGHVAEGTLGEVAALVYSWRCPESGRDLSLAVAGKEKHLPALAEGALAAVGCHGHGEVVWGIAVLDPLPPEWSEASASEHVRLYTAPDGARVLTWRTYADELGTLRCKELGAAAIPAVIPLLGPPGRALTAADFSKVVDEDAACRWHVDVPYPDGPVRVGIRGGPCVDAGGWGVAVAVATEDVTATCR